MKSTSGEVLTRRKAPCFNFLMNTNTASFKAAKFYATVNGVAVGAAKTPIGAARDAIRRGWGHTHLMITDTDGVEVMQTAAGWTGHNVWTAETRSA